MTEPEGSEEARGQTGEAGGRPAHERLENVVSHLRTVHFSLLVVSLACLVALSVEVPLDIRSAIDSLTSLRKLEGQDPGRWLLEVVGGERIDEGLPPEGRVLRVFPDYDEMLRTVGALVSIEMLCEFPELVVSLREGDFSGSAFYFYRRAPTAEEEPPATGVGLGVFETVHRPRQVQELWEALGRAPGIVYVPVAYRVVEPEGFDQATSSDGGGAGRPVRFPTGGFHPCMRKPWVRSETNREAVLGGCWTGTTGQEFEIELTLRKHSAHLLPGLASYLHVPTEEPSFSRAFPALSKWMVGRSAEEFGVLDAELRGAQALAQREQALELFGAEVPVSQLTLWGSIVVLALQLYFLVHLRQLLQTAPVATGTLLLKRPPLFPWIVIYPGFSASLVSYASIALLPIAVVAVLSWKSFGAGGSPGLGIAGTATSLGLAVSCLLVLRKVRSSKRSRTQTP